MEPVCRVTRFRKGAECLDEGARRELERSGGSARCRRQIRAPEARRDIGPQLQDRGRRVEEGVSRPALLVEEVTIGEVSDQRSRVVVRVVPEAAPGDVDRAGTGRQELREIVEVPRRGDTECLGEVSDP